MANGRTEIQIEAQLQSSFSYHDPLGKYRQGRNRNKTCDLLGLPGYGQEGEGPREPSGFERGEAQSWLRGLAGWPALFCDSFPAALRSSSLPSGECPGP